MTGTTPPPDTPGSITWRGAIAGGVLLLLLVLAGLWLGRTSLAETVLGSILRDRTGADVEISVAEVGLDHAVVDRLQIGAEPTLAAERIEISYELSGLRAGRVDTVTIQGLRLKATVGPDGVTFGPLDALLAGERSGEPVALPTLRVTAAEISLSSPFGPAKASGDLSLTPDGGGAKITSELVLGLPAGRLSGALRLDLDADGAVAGKFSIAPGDLAPSPDVRLSGLGGEVTFARASGAQAPTFNARLAAAAGTVHGRKLGAARTTIDFDGTLLRLDGRLATADAAASATFTGKAEPLATPMRFSSEADIAATTGAALWDLLPLPANIQVAGAVSAKVTTRAEGTPADMSGTVTIAAQAADVRAGPVATKSARLDYSGMVTVSGDRLSIVTRSGSLGLSAPVIEIAGAGRFTLSDTLTLALETGSDPALLVTSGDDGQAEVRHRVAIASADFAAVLKTGAGSEKISGRTPRIVLESDTAILTDGRLDLPGFALGLDGIGARIALAAPPAANADTARELAHITVATIAGRAKRPPVVPLGLDMRLTETDTGKLAFDGSLSDASGRLTLSVRGGHDPASATGSARLDLKKLFFGVGIDGPETLFPILRSDIANTAGGLAMTSRLSWNGPSIAARGKILVEDLSVDFSGVGLRQANTILTFDTGRAKGTREVQEIAIGALDVGIPLTNGLARLRIGAGGRLLVEEMTWSLAGGRVFARDFTVDPGAKQQKLLLEVAEVDFAELAALFQLEGISAAGRLGGRIPVTIRDGGVLILGGELATGAPGVIRYKPGQYPAGLSSGGEGMALALKALENFHYDTLRLTLNREFGGETVVTLHIKGRNPELYSGYPIALNLSLSGRLDEILQQSLEGYRVPDRIRQRMLDFEK